MSAMKDEAANIADDAKKVARMAKENPWIERMTRLGYAVRGMLYGMIGGLAVQAALTGRGDVVDQNGVLEAIASRSLGQYALMVIAVGLLGLFIWGIVRAVADPYRKGKDFKGVVSRIGYLVSGLLYAALLYPTIKLIIPGDNGQDVQAMAQGLLSQSSGRWLVGAVGVVIFAVGLYQIYSGLNVKFNTRFEPYRISDDHRRLAVTMGRIGFGALGVVLLITGSLTVYTASVLPRAAEIATLDQALLFLVRQPYGPYLMAIVAVGLLAFAVYSFMGALWFRLRRL